MNPEVFFENFALLAEVPNGVQKLREMILQLALMGKLVSQDPNDESAYLSLERIIAEKKQLGKEGKNGPKPINAINTGQIPYEIPSTWKWTTLSNCGSINPRNDISDEKEVSFVPMACISEKYGQNIDMEIRKWEEIKKGFTHFAENDVVLAKITPCFQNGKSAVMKGLKNGYGAGTTELHVFRPLKGLINSDYVLIYIKSPDFIYNGVPKMTGTAGQKRVTKDYFSENPFPLPPLAEQKRIVDKVDELIALCNKLEIRHHKKQELQSKLNSSALDRMLSAENQEEFEQNWKRICENFDILYDNPENVEKLRQAIIQLAVQGKLVEQNPEDEPASELLERIEVEKKKLVKEGKIKGSKPLAEISDDEILFEVPASWKWARFDDICSYIQRGKSPKYVDESDFPVIAQKCIQWDGLKIDRAKFIDPLTVEQYEEVRFLRTGDLLWNSTGTGTLGRVIVYVHEENAYDKVVADTHVTVVRSLIVDPYYMNSWIASPIIQDNIESIASGSTNQIELATSTVKNHLIPLPPLAEQRRIVEKVEQLMDLCDELESKLRLARGDSGKLMEAVVKGLLEGATA